MAESSRAEVKTKTFGIAFPSEDMDRMDAVIRFLYPTHSHRKRSEFVVNQVYAGLEARFGSRWRDLADRLIAEQDDRPEADELVAIPA